MDNMKLVHSYYYANDVSEVIIEYKGKRFYGYAKLHPEDKIKNLNSEYAGCRFAELRAQIKALKWDYQQQKQQCEQYKNFVKACAQSKNFDKQSPTAKIIFRQLNSKIKQVNKLADKINQKLMDLDYAIKQKEIISNALQRNRAKKINQL